MQVGEFNSFLLVCLEDLNVVFNIQFMSSGFDASYCAADDNEMVLSTLQFTVIVHSQASAT